MIRVVAVGNQLRKDDATGRRILGCVADRGGAQHAELLDGGLAGFDLVTLLDDCSLTIFVDGFSGFAESGSVVELRPSIGPEPLSLQWDHGSGLGLLLAAIPHLDPAPRSDVVVVGVELPAHGADIVRAAERVLQIISDPPTRTNCLPTAMDRWNATPGH